MSEQLTHRRPELRFVTIREFAAYMGVSYMTIRREIDRGVITAVRVGHQIRIPVTEIDRYTRTHWIEPGEGGW